MFLMVNGFIASSSRIRDYITANRDLTLDLRPHIFEVDLTSLGFDLKEMEPIILAKSPVVYKELGFN